MDKKTLLSKLKILEDESEKIWKSLEGLSEENYRDTSYGWSILQVLVHLNMAESGSLKYMNKKILAGSHMKDNRLINRLRLFLTRFFLQSSIKWKAPKPISNPEKDITFDEVVRRFGVTRNEMKEFIESYPLEYLDKNVMRHPVAGRLTLDGTLDSFIYHQRHHVHQIKRIRNMISV